MKKVLILIVALMSTATISFAQTTEHPFSKPNILGGIIEGIDGITIMEVFENRNVNVIVRGKSLEEIIKEFSLVYKGVVPNSNALSYKYEDMIHRKQMIATWIPSLSIMLLSVPNEEGALPIFIIPRPEE